MAGKGTSGHGRPDPLLQSLAETHAEPFALVDRDFVVVACNRRYAEVYAGSEPAQLIGKTCHAISHKSATPCALNGEDCPLQYVFESGRPYQVIHRHLDCLHDPDYVVIHASPILDADGKVAYMGESATSIGHDDLHAAAHAVDSACCPSFMPLLPNLTTVAATDAPVLILGEPGTGKELAARLIHRGSQRALKEFVQFDCRLHGEEEQADEIFGRAARIGHGDLQARRGRLEAADGGSLFLREVAELAPSVQRGLLQFLETGEFRRAGEHRARRANVRLLCASSRDLKEQVENGGFCGELYARIRCMQVELPPLRHRRDDIPRLAECFLGQAGRPARSISTEALAALRHYAYPGNVRELRNILERAALLARGVRIQLEHLPREVVDPALAPSPSPLRDERGFHVIPAGAAALSPHTIRKALEKFHGNRRLAAQALGISERTLYRRLKTDPTLA